MSDERPAEAAGGAKGGRLLALATVPLVLLAGLLLAIVRLDPAARLRGAAPPVEVLAYERVELGPDGFTLTVLNDGPDPVTVAQVMVDEAYWAYEMEPARPLTHLERATIRIPYPWVEGETHALRLITATGITFDHEVAVAVATPVPSAEIFGFFALVGLYVGVLPVALGLLWYPLMRRLGRRGRDFVLALTVGLLLFLLVDALHDGVEIAKEMPGSYQGVALLAFAALAAYLALAGLGAALGRRRGGEASAWVTALLVAVGIGVHNLGEGLAIGAAFALGEAALGTLLIVGFTLHNTTEGLAIVAPLSSERTGIGRLALLGALAGIPTIAGGWIGGLVYVAAWSVVFLGIGAGAIAQVAVQVLRSAAREREISDYLTSAPVATGLLAGIAVMYATGMLVG